MTISKTRMMLAGAGAMALLTFLFVEQMPLNTGWHDTFVRDLQRMKQLEHENSRLKGALADAMLDNQILKELNEKK